MIVMNIKITLKMNIERLMGRDVKIASIRFVIALLYYFDNHMQFLYFYPSFRFRTKTPICNYEKLLQWFFDIMEYICHTLLCS